LKFFFDNCTWPPLAACFDGYLRHLGHGAAHIRDLPCGANATDLEWIAMLRAEDADWVVITGDLRIQRNRAERLAFRQASLSVRPENRLSG
jgi:predicted nuclease of predicted toxin-antitoxin system